MNVRLSELISANRVIGVAVSGGMDSIALLHYIKSREREYGYKTVAVNIDHSIRAESASDSEFVKKYCDKACIPLLFKKIDCCAISKQRKISIETAARILRYEAFFEFIESGECDVVATAHHKSDNVEGILLNLFRGSGAEGMSGMKKTAYDGKIIRPFLNVSKSEIIEYVKENDLEYVVDKTNFDSEYTRNFVRLEILPKIKEKFPSVETAITRFAKTLAQENDYLNTIASNYFKLENGEAKLDATVEEVIFNRATVLAFKAMGYSKDFEKQHINAVFALVSKNSGTRSNVFSDLIAVRDYDCITLYRAIAENKCVEYKFGIGKFDFIDCEIEITDNESAEGLKFDLDKIPEKAVIRYREDGDVFTKFSGGTKKLKDYLIDKKVPNRVRNALPLVAVGKKVLIISGIEISDAVKLDGGTKKVLKLVYRKKKNITT